MFPIPGFKFSYRGKSMFSIFSSIQNYIAGRKHFNERKMNYVSKQIIMLWKPREKLQVLTGPHLVVPNHKINTEVAGPTMQKKNI